MRFEEEENFSKLPRLPELVYPLLALLFSLLLVCHRFWCVGVLIEPPLSSSSSFLLRRKVLLFRPKNWRKLDFSSLAYETRIIFCSALVALYCWVVTKTLSGVRKCLLKLCTPKMNRSFLRNFSFCTRNLLLHRLNHSPNPSPTSYPLSASCTRSIIPKFFSSSNNLPDEASFLQTSDKCDPSRAEDVVSKEELKKRIAKLEDGNTEAIPGIFEGILSRLLAGKPEEAHDELRKELLGDETESADDTEDQESDFDEETSDTDEE